MAMKSLSDWLSTSRWFVPIPRSSPVAAYWVRVLSDFPAWVLFSGLLLAYTAVIAATSSSGFEFDEEVYLDAARRLCQGRYADPANPDLVAPGYPLFLALFAPLGWPLWLMRWVNAPLLAGAAVFFFQILSRYLPRFWAVAIPVVFGLHPQLLRTAPMLMSESFSVCLLLAFMAAIIRLIRSERLDWKWIAAAAVLLALTALTRSLFAYVAVAGAGFSLLIACARACRPLAVRTLLVAGGSLMLCAPYLAYTKSLTGENFCWATNGGLHLYSITSPHPGEWGSWLSPETVEESEVARHFHGDFLTRTTKLPVLEREAAFAAKAQENLREHPAAFIRNLAANASRFFFGFPWSYQLERMRTHLLLWPHALLLAAFLLSLWPALLRFRRIPVEITVLLVFALIYIGGSLLLPANPRYFIPVIPFLLLWVAVLFHRFVDFRLALRS